MPGFHAPSRAATVARLSARVVVTLALCFGAAVSSEAVAYAVDCVAPDDPAGCTTPSPTPSATDSPSPDPSATPTPSDPTATATDPAPSGSPDGSAAAPLYVALEPTQLYVLVLVAGLLLVLQLVTFFLRFGGDSFVSVGRRDR